MTIVLCVICVCSMLSYLGYLDDKNLCKHKFKIISQLEIHSVPSCRIGTLYVQECIFCGALRKEKVIT